MNNHRILRLCLMAALLLGAAQLSAQPRRGRGFSEASLKGSYAAREQGDGSVSAGLGVVRYDGAGKTTRKLTVNAPDGNGGRRMLTFEAEGDYTVNPDGAGAA
ncbi:MAG: hypothetical protein GY953_05970, partial [bacterium]|nr:hypothetical protein [bacterium]